VTDTVVTILLVDDDKIDTRALRRSFQALKFDNPIIEARSGMQAMDLLRGENSCKTIPWPFVILLDLSMPGMDGFEFLEKLRSDPDLRCAPIFVMSGSESAEDRTRAYDLNITGFIRKQNPSKSFLKEVEMLQHYIRVTEFPEQPTKPGLSPAQRVAGKDNEWSLPNNIMWNTHGRRR
jgi:CheY-like chemotaxis protein